MTKSKIRNLLNDTIECLKSCIEDEHRLAHGEDVDVWVACFAKGKADGYKKAIELLDYIVDQVR